MTKWEPVKETEKYGIAIYNFRQDASFRLQIALGEAVLMLRQNGGWYFGYTLKNNAVRGFFPKSYVHVCDCVPEKTGCGQGLVLRQPPVVQELTAVLREWGVNWKKLYIKNSKLFKPVENFMNELISCRKKILSGTLPVDELKEIKKHVTSKIDVGNELLGLDMVVRDEHGNIVNPEMTSTIQLFRQHELATERIRAAMLGSPEKPTEPVTLLSHTFFVSVRTILCRLEQDVEFLMALYDAREGRTFTENFVIRWTKEDLAKNQDQNLNMRVLFTDLGSKDMRREKVYLVCYAVRLGSMELCDPDQKNRRSSSNSSSGVKLRRPYGVGALDVTMYTSGQLQSDDETLQSISFLQCGERDDLEGTLKKILTLKEISARDHKGQGLRVSVRLLRGDLKQVREENPHLMLGTVAIARKMGFPEVILPGDVRNDLYLSLLSGEFSKGSKSTDKNVEVTVRVCSEDGQIIENVVSMGGGVPLQSEYSSVVYYHEDKPRWYEAFRIAVGIEKIEEFKVSHLIFSFKHRSSNEAKDKAEKPFALSYVRLIQDNGTTIQDTQHELLVYKIDHKKYVESDRAYLQLPSTRAELQEGQKPSKPGLSLSMKDNFLINTSVCSTKLTQNVDLLALLNWSSRPENLKESLEALMKVGGEEVVKFIPDILDALFSILMQNSNSDLYDNMVFECLLHVIGLVSDLKYQHFQPILDLYIKENFCATLAYNKLIVVLTYHINNATTKGAQNHDLLYKTMKSIQYCIRFIVRSRELFAQMNENKGQQQFEVSLQVLFVSICKLMEDDSGETLKIQGACLRYLPSAIPDILCVYDRLGLSVVLMDVISSLGPGRLTMQKMMTIKDIVHSELFNYPDCRKILLPWINSRVKRLLEAQEEGRSAYHFIHKIKSVAKIAKILGASKRKLHEHHAHSDEMDLCVNVLGDIMDQLFATKPVEDIKEMMLSILRTVIQTTIALDRESILVGSLAAVMLSIFRQMDSHHFDVYLSHFPTTTDLLDFLMEILLVFKDLVARPVFPSQWCEMMMLQNNIMLRALRFFSHTIRDRFFQPFEHQAWNNFFHCAIAFMTQPALQLDRFSVSKRFRLTSRYRDMRSEMGAEILSMWFNLGQAKIQFVPGLVGSFLKMTLIPETELRRKTIPIFFDMMQCEFYSSRHPGESYADTKRDSSHIKANFSQFEDEMIAKLDTLIEEGWGDEHYKDLFHTIMIDHCLKHATMKEQGMRFVETTKKLIERLLEYRSVINDENKENRMICTVNLLNFYSDIKREQMYIRYVNKLCDLHLECDNFTEAAYTLQLHSQLLDWSDAPLPPLLLSTRFPFANTHRQLKEALYKLTIDFFDKGKMWEAALKECKELERQYEEEIMDYTQLSELHSRMSQFYDNIMKQVRPKPGYFRVGYYGKGFPSFLQNKVFIYRGKEYERLSEFSSRTINQLPNAELMKTLTPPGKDITESLGQFVQINNVDPVMSEETLRIVGRPVSEQVLQYHRVNNIMKFRFSRPYHKRDPAYTAEDADTNEFASLWVERTVLVTSYPLPGILQWFPVRSSQTFEISPLQNAIETMESSNKALQELIISYGNDTNMSLKPLTMRLSGILDAAVMGGITNYEKAFFSPEYINAHSDRTHQLERLRNLIAEQIPLLGLGISLHSTRAPPLLSKLHSHLEKCYNDMKAHVEERYGKRTCNLKLNSTRNGRRKSRSGFGFYDQENGSNRSSDASLTPSESNNWSRVSSLTRQQVSSLKNLAGFSFTSSMSGGATLGRSWRGNSSSQLEYSSPVSVRSMSSKFSRSTSLMTDSPDSPSKGKDTERENRKSEEKRNRLRKPVSLRHGSRKNSVDSKADLSISSTGSSLWYTDTSVVEPPAFSTPTAPVASPAPAIATTPVTPVFELRQELTPLRPLRSDVEREKRMSRPSSGQFPSGPTTPIGGNSGSGTSSNRDSVETASEDDGLRPPLPLKSRETDSTADGGSDADAEADYSNLPIDFDSAVVENHVRSSPSTPSLRGKVLPPTPVEETCSTPLPPALPVTPSSVRTPKSPDD